MLLLILRNGVCQDRHDILLYFHKPAADRHCTLDTSLIGNLKIAGFEARDQRGMICQDAEVSQVPGGDDGGNLCVIYGLLRSYNRQMEAFGHLFPPHPLPLGERVSAISLFASNF